LLYGKSLGGTGRREFPGPQLYRRRIGKEKRTDLKQQNGKGRREGWVAKKNKAAASA